MRQNRIKIDFYNEQQDSAFTPSLRAYMKMALTAVVKYFGIPTGVQVSVSLVDENTIRECNKENRSIDRVTDVLSFPLQNFCEGSIDYDDISDGEFDENSNLMLGDVVICMAVAERQAEEYGHSLEREAVYLFVHSILHLLGFDHEDEDMRTHMREAEEIIMNKIGLSRDE